MKYLKKAILYLMISVGVLLAGGTLTIFLFKDKIIREFIRRANSQINTKIKVGSFDVSWFEDFPNLSVVLNDVYVEDSHEGIYPLLTAETVSFQLNMVELWSGNYEVDGVHILNSETNLKINSAGVNNYTITNSKTASGSESLVFSLREVQIQNAKVVYLDATIDEELRFATSKLIADIRTAEDVYDIAAKGDITTEKIRVRNNETFVNKTFEVKTELTYNDLKKIVTITPSDLKLKTSSFKVEGTYEWKSQNLIDLKVKGTDTDVQTLLSLLPEDVSSSFSKYQSKGTTYFDGELKGSFTSESRPSVSIRFGFDNATLYHPDYDSRIENVKMEGSFASSDISDPRQAVLILKNIHGNLNGRSFEADLAIHNFKDSEVQLQFNGELDAQSMLGFYPVKDVSDAHGLILADINFEGRLSWLKSKATAKKASTRGTVELKDLSFTFEKEELTIENLKGILQFNNNDLALSNVSAKLGNSDFLLNGFFKNVITFLLFENQPIGIETDLVSQHLDLNQLLALGFNTYDASGESQYQFSISRNINLNFNCDVKSLNYKRFQAEDLKGDLLVKNEMAVSRNIKMKSMGGNLNFSGIIDSKNQKAIDVVSSFHLDGIHLDSIFFVFENFDQSFIQDKHLKGKVQADVNLEMVLSPALKLFNETLIADISAIVKEGELNDFEPLRKLDKYIDDSGLDNIRFLDLKNDIHIENQTVYIPQMDVRTNVTNLRISGTHTFNQQIDYHIIAPLRSYKKINIGEAGNAIESIGEGQSKIYLKIVGTTDNYRVLYDTEAVKKKIVNDLKEEVKELKDAFKSKGVKKQKELELEEGEYFDWEVK